MFLKIRKIVFSTLGLLLFYGGIAQNIPSRYRKTVAFISYTDDLGRSKDLGTGFYFLVYDSSLVFFYLVTARHVIVDSSTKKTRPKIKLSYNTIDQRREYINIDLFEKGPQKSLFFHRDTSVDIAVISLPFLNMVKKADIQFASIDELFRSKSDFDSSYINPGTNIFYTGMFSPYMGYSKNYPITRFGKISLLTPEKIQFAANEPKTELILAETTTFGGNSGSPVFAYGSSYKINSHDSTDRINLVEQSNVKIYMVGLMKGYFQEKSPIEFINTGYMTPSYSTNIGVAAIIPSYLLYEIIMGDDVKQFRKVVILNQLR